MLKYDTHVYLGPTLDTTRARQYLPEAHYHPPIQCGDLIKLFRIEPKRVVIIDGIYETVPAVWHKEIMLAMHLGIEVFGAASMGALRAAELHQFGMIGVGEVFNLYIEKKLFDDDEVAVLHQGKDEQFLPINDAMVNIRATVKIASQLNIISNEFAEQLLIYCKRQFYPYRSLKQAALHFVSVFYHESHKLINWLATNGLVDIKQRDAIAVLQQVATVKSIKKLKLQIPMTKFIASLVDDVGVQPFDTHEEWMPAAEKKLYLLAENQPIHFKLVTELAKWLKHLAESTHEAQLLNASDCLEYIQMYALYSPEKEFQSLQNHPDIAFIYPTICGLICLGHISEKMIASYLPVAAFYFGFEYSETDIFEKNLLRQILVFILLAHTQLQDKQLKIKQQVMIDHLKDIGFWQKYHSRTGASEINLRVAIDFIAIYMQITYIYQGFKDSRLGEAPLPTYFKWIYDALDLSEVTLPAVLLPA